LRISKSSIPKAFTTPIAGHGFLQDLAELTQAALAALRRVPDFSAEFSDRKYDQRKHDANREAHLPIDVKHHDEKNDEREAFLKEIGENIGERDAGLLDVVDHRGQNAARRIVLEEPNRLTNNFAYTWLRRLVTAAWPTY